MESKLNNRLQLHAVSPYIRVAHDYVTGKDMHVGPARIVDHALHYFKEGEGVYVIGRDKYPITPGSLFLVRPGETLSIAARPGTSFHMLNLHFDIIEQEDSRSVPWPYPKEGDRPRDPSPYCLPAPSSGPQTEGLPNVTQVAEKAQYEYLFYRVLQYFRNDTTVGRLLIKSRFLELLAFLWGSQEHAGDARGPEHFRDNINRAVAYMHSHIQDAVTLEQLASAAHMSKSYFIKCFREHYRMSPMKFLRRQRLEQAKFELVMTAKPIKTIAEEIGCDSIHQFYHLFSREIGCSPGSYRKNHTPSLANQ